MNIYRYLLAFGSNLGNRKEHFNKSLVLLEPYIHIMRQSHWRETPPLKNSLYQTNDHENYLNFVCEASSHLNPFDLYKLIVKVEDEIGHSRERAWLPRQLDIDILFCAKNDHELFEQCTPIFINDLKNDFFIPHKGYQDRIFLKEMVENELQIMIQDNRKKVVFLGTPDVAAKVLDVLVHEASHIIKIILAVSQPPARHSRNAKEEHSPVHALALSKGIPVFTPESAKDKVFLSDLRMLEPDLCVTAAYGNYLPKDFLSIPKFGTLNIHPSLLPLYRGAAPVQRTIENGDKVTGVSVLYSVAAMDAGPIIAQEKYELNGEINTNELLPILFKMGARLLIKNLSSVFQNKENQMDQSYASATNAPKINIEESTLDFALPAVALHNKVRAFVGWPGTKAKFILNDEAIELKIIKTRVAVNKNNLNPGEVLLNKNSVDVCCGDNYVLEILEVQAPGKKILNAIDFKNGLKGKSIRLYTI